jgi:hypothetical protein
VVQWEARVARRDALRQLYEWLQDEVRGVFEAVSDSWEQAEFLATVQLAQAQQDAWTRHR